jgi:hypothetical protein
MATLIFGIVVGVVINLITAFFSRKHARQLLPWLLLYIGIHGFAVLLNYDPVKIWGMAIARSNSPWKTYPVVIIAVSILASIYWWSVNAAVHKLDKATSEDSAKGHPFVPTIPVNHALASPQPAPPKKTEAITPVEIAPAYGNLKPRCVELSDGIAEFVRHRNDQLQNEKLYPKPLTQERADEWQRSNDSGFRTSFMEQVKTLHDDLARVNLRDSKLDGILKSDQDLQETVRLRMQSFPGQQPKGMGWIQITQIARIGERLAVLAKQIPSHKNSSGAVEVLPLTHDNPPQITIQRAPQQDVATVINAPRALLESDIPTIRKNAVSFLNTTYDMLNGPRETEKMLQGATMSQEKRMYILNDAYGRFARDYNAKLRPKANGIREALEGNIKTQPARDSDALYTYRDVPDGFPGLNAVEIEMQLKDLRALLNEMERENNLPLSCQDLYFHF